MTVSVDRIETGLWRENCYIVHRRDGQALVIDPGADVENILAKLAEHALTPLAILNTHAHYDHIGAVAALRRRFEIPFYLHIADAELLKRANLYKLLFDSRNPVTVPPIDIDIAQLPPHFAVGPFDIEWIATPGHTLGGVCFRLADTIFTGDTLIPGSKARTDLPGGNPRSHARSLAILAKLPGDLTLFAGHGKPSTMARALDGQFADQRA